MKLNHYVVDNDYVSVVGRIERRDPTKDEIAEAGLRTLWRKSPRAKWRHADGKVYEFVGHEIIMPIGSGDSLSGYVINSSFDFWRVEATVYPKYRGPDRMASTIHGGSTRHHFDVFPPMTHEGAVAFMMSGLLSDIKRVSAAELLKLAAFHTEAAREVLK